MNKTMLGLVAALALGVAAWVIPISQSLGTPAAPAQPAAVPKVEPVKWECAELRVTAHPYWNVATTGEAKPDSEVVLNLPAKAHKSETFAGLAEPLGQKPTQETAAEVLSILGKDGWEPASFGATEWVNSGRAIKRVEVWTLKRPVKK